MSEQDKANVTAGLSRRKMLSVATIAPVVAAVGLGTAQKASAQTSPGNGKAAIVTGSSRGIGAATAKQLARDGYAVTVNCRVNRDLAAAVVAEIEAEGGRAIWEQADVADPAAVKRLFDANDAAFGGVDVVVSNAGMMRLAPVAQMTDEDFDAMLNTNIKGSFNVLREASARVRDHGRIITLSSSITQLRSPTYGPYAASKAAQEIYANILAKELAGRMISVNAMAPGLVNTTLFTDGKTPEQIAGFVSRTPHGRLGEPEDIANVISELCAEKGWWINGQTVFANGGVV
ncbi:3-ketoacyl-ACP reductase [Brucella pseudogrignonensis]|uniref:SDR family oxidoreductase n=1 Tax=Brucella pseudogrignonensis TaxID=419475 RepID=UPI0007DA88F0|nr:SDR family oxidoreductase [Brucella pseudogrignonensis]ANG98751.1 3-ketoacyl-ACP reductase [Brucella pseudogrignonensis]